jgi:adenylate cyclase
MRVEIQRRRGETLEFELIVQLEPPFQLGRAQNSTELPGQCCEEPPVPRCVIAVSKDVAVSKTPFRIDSEPDGKVRITKMGASFDCRSSSDLPWTTVQETVSLPLTSNGVSFRLTPSRIVTLLPSEQPTKGQHVRERPPLPLQFEVTGTFAVPSGLGTDPASTSAALRAVIGMLQLPPSREGYYDSVARTVVDITGLDAASVVLFDTDPTGEAWYRLAGQHARSGKQVGTPSTRIMAEVRGDGKPRWVIEEQEGSLADVNALVAAPILSANGGVIGVVYADQRSGQGTVVPEVLARLVEVMACGVAASLARERLERDAKLFEQFFTTGMARELLDNQRLLEAKEVDVTVLFCDIRDFSELSRKHEHKPTLLCRWLRDMLTELSSCVLEEGGVLIDYVGDALMAMWGAPKDQSDHAHRGYRAAQAMLTKVRDLQARWGTQLGTPLDVSVGTNSGAVIVGNIGSTQKYKYGALGPPVNLASRLQGATKQCKARLLLSASTRTLLPLEVRQSLRHLGQLQLSGMGGPVEVYEGPPPAVSLSEDKALLTRWLQEGTNECRYSTLADAWKFEYEAAWRAFRDEKWGEAARLLAPLVEEPIGDGPSLKLLARVVQAMADEKDIHHPVWKLSSK